MRYTEKKVLVSKLPFISLTQIARHKTSLASYEEDSEYKELNAARSRNP